MYSSVILALLLATLESHSELDEFLQEDLVAVNGHRLTPSEIPEAARLIAFYYTASWCANCKAIEESMVKAKELVEEQNPNVRFVWISLDRSASEMARYYARGKYEGLAVRPGVTQKQIPGAEEALDVGLPAMRVYDRESGEIWSPTAEISISDLSSQLKTLIGGREGDI